MFGIIKLGIIPKLALIIVAAAGAAYVGHAITSPPPSQTAETAEKATDISNANPAPPAGALHAFHARINAASPFWRIIIFLVVAFLLPIATISIVKRMLSHASNTRNFLMLAAYTVADFILALLLVGILMTDFWAMFLVILAMISSAVYNYVILNRIEELEND
jgi:hypothetical protein